MLSDAGKKKLGRPKKVRKGRPKRDRNSVFQLRLNMWLIRGEDDDLIALFENVPTDERVQLAKLAWRKGAASMQQVEVDNTEELLDALFNEL